MGTIYEFSEKLKELQSLFETPSFNYMAEINDHITKTTDIFSRNIGYYNDLIVSLSKLSEFSTVSSLIASQLPLKLKKFDNDELNNTSTGDNTRRLTSLDSTDTVDVNSINQEFFTFLSKYSQPFVHSLKITDFEDGIDNLVTIEVREFVKRNLFVTYIWLNTIYSNNQKDSDVIAGLLRIIGVVVEQENSDMLLPIVIAGLANINSKTQEAALMVIEQWRTKNCLDALQTTNFSSVWLKEYAKQIEAELIEELCLC